MAQPYFSRVIPASVSLLVEPGIAYKPSKFSIVNDINCLGQASQLQCVCAIKIFVTIVKYVSVNLVRERTVRYLPSMRLKKLKLAGFKSFVDPTTVPLPSNLIGIVGPNGCGKSNVIDAVRWVMGESSAKNLRGDSMADVIFNGSTTRKPVGQATVELVFDNADGSLGGQYANYNEIAVKRSVSRDGQSNYFLNGTKCRRRDITDIFLGTGLGPRSYAIIEQGTISRIIEARPEELRVFLEEAAGISRYKERRRETENRIKHTRENLDRLNDLREELDKQLARLKRQSKTAERYKILREEEKLLKAQLQALRWQDLNAKVEVIEHEIRQKQNMLDAIIAEQRGLEAEIEKFRQQHTEASDDFNKVQSRYYSVGADIARLEQSIQHVRERRQQQETDLRAVENEWQQAQQQFEKDQNRIKEISAELAELEPQLKLLHEQATVSVAELEQSEKTMQAWQHDWDEFNRAAQEPVQTAEVERTRIQHLETQLSELASREQKLKQEIASTSAEAFNQDIARLNEELAQYTENVQQHEREVGQIQSLINTTRELINTNLQALDSQRGELQSMRGRFGSLEALQQAALGKEENAITSWLNQHNLNDAPRLAEALNVEAGWERAVECVLGSYLQSVCIDDIDDISFSIGEISEGSLTLVSRNQQDSINDDSKHESILTKINSEIDLSGLLKNIRAVATLTEALAARAHLAADESIITQDGIWIARNWVRIVNDNDAQAGILKREQELKQLADEIANLTQTSHEQQNEIEHQQQQLKDFEVKRAEEQTALNQSSRQQADTQAQLNAKQQAMAETQQRSENLTTEYDKTVSQIDTDSEALRTARNKLQAALDSMAGHETERADLLQKRDTLRAALETSRQAANADREKAHQINVKVETLRTEQNSTEQTHDRMQSQLDSMSSKRSELNKGILESEQPLKEMTAELETYLAQRVAIETELSTARQAMENIEQGLTDTEQKRVATEQRVEVARGELEQARINSQEVRVRRQTIEEQLSESGFELNAVIAELPEEASLDAWREQVEEMERKINRLGPINLAAIDEFEQESERKMYLDAQNEDLIQALSTLEEAIKKIDRETRTRFSDTFDRVNNKLKDLFPRLFGGGHAYLELTDDEILEAGVTVMARPPGKRNSTIHLLSGGEKALTAVALVFAIFELNPAPFCMLDEVDAPLDDANVGRFRELVKYMSERIQFIFITHNKVTMEIADQLTGVTMSEPGVSHLVAVDVDEAVELAAV